MLIKNCSTVLYTTQNNTLTDITTSFEERDKLIQEIVATKLQDMVKTVVASSSRNELKLFLAEIKKKGQTN